MWRPKDRFNEQPIIIVGKFKDEARYLPGANQIRLKGNYSPRLIEHRVVQYLNHEYMHYILFKLEGLRTSKMYDSPSPKFEESWNMLPPFLPEA